MGVDEVNISIMARPHITCTHHRKRGINFTIRLATLVNGALHMVGFLRHQECMPQLAIRHPHFLRRMVTKDEVQGELRMIGVAALGIMQKMGDHMTDIGNMS
jgi:hypothetical protein